MTDEEIGERNRLVPFLVVMDREREIERLNDLLDSSCRQIASLERDRMREMGCSTTA